MVVAPGVVEVVCFYGFNPTPINLIKKRKELRLKIELFDMYGCALRESGGGLAYRLAPMRRCFASHCSLMAWN
ncbi:hypothetical protein [Pseudomonas sp. TWI929]|uniref:hypothetical protein n=1 Tax=Pseudomonas sp. TWI929 TaxID=3136795 RepID=UPI0032079CEA